MSAGYGLRARWFGVWFVLAAAAGMTPDSWADEPSLNRIAFQVERGRNVATDRVTAVLLARFEERDAARVADRINQEMARAVERAKQLDGLEVRTGGYRTNPVRDPKSQRIRAWQGSQELILESREPAALSLLLAELQAKLQLVSLEFDISPERRRAVESELVAEVLGAFRARADGVRKELEARTYRIVQIQLSSLGSPNPVRPRMMRTAMLAESVAPPVLEGGTRMLSQRASGTIELEF